MSSYAVGAGIERVPREWERDPVASLPGLLPGEAVVGSAGRGARDKAFDHDRAASYPARLALSAAARRPELLAVMRRAGVTGARVLDIGCGPGVASAMLVDAGALAVTGWDASEAMVGLARRLDVDRCLDLAVVDASASPLPAPSGSFDVVWAADCWPGGALPELWRVLRPGGTLVRTTTAGQWLTYPFDPGLDLRARLAEHEGLSRWRPDAPAGAEDARPGRGWTPVDAWTSIVERRHPVPDLYAEYRSQTFGLFTGGFVVDHVDAGDWSVLSRLWDPDGAQWLFRRPDAHLLTGMHHQVWARQPTR